MWSQDLGRMEDTLQQALFGGHISGRRLRGVKINPIYQGSEPGVLERSPADTQSESALPIGEIQIEVYDSLPRSGQRPFRQSRSSPVIAARGLSVGRGSEEGGGNSSRPPGRDTCVSAARSEVRKVEDVRLSPTVSSAMDVDNVPWTFLQDRSPVQRQPLWGAFWGPGTPTPTHPPHSHQPPPGTGDRQTSFQTRTKSSSSLFVVPPPDKIDVIGDESSDEDVGSVKTPGAEERCETRSGEENRPDGVNSSSGVKNAVSVEQSATCFAADASSERVDVAPPHNSSLNEKTQSEASLTSREYVYSDFVHFAEHNCHHYSGYDILDSRPASLNDISERLPLTHHPTQGGNGLSLSGVFPVLKAHTMCTCPCHSRKFSQDSMTVMAGSDTSEGEDTPIPTTENGEVSGDAIDQLETCPSKSAPDLTTMNFSLKGVRQPSPLGGKTESLPDVKAAPFEAATLARYEQNVCLLDLENNNYFSVVFHKRKDISRQSSEHLGNDLNDRLSFDEKLNLAHKTVCSLVRGSETAFSEVTKDTLENRDCQSKDSSSNSVHTRISTDKNGEYDIGNGICKLCGCFLNSGYTRNQTVNNTGNRQTECVDGKKATQETSPQANEISNVKSLLCSDSILLRADELNAPAYLQRYLLEAQKHYLQQNPYPATIPTYSDLPSSAHPTSDNADATTAANDNNNDDDDAIPRELLDFLAAEDDLALNGGDAVSVVEELGSQRTKSASWKKSFRSTGSGRSGAASTNSKTDSRQSSRTGKHSSIEDLDAEDGWWWAAAGEGVGSVWGGSGGSSNRSSSLVDRNENLKKAGLSIIHVEGNSTDPGFEMIVPYEASDEELDSNYSSRRRRQRREELAEQSSWKGEKVSMRERLIKAGLITLIFGVLVGIFIGVVIHFSKESKGGEEGADVEGGLLPHGGSFHGFRR